MFLNKEFHYDGYTTKGRHNYWTICIQNKIEKYTHHIKSLIFAEQKYNVPAGTFNEQNYVHGYP